MVFFKAHTYKGIFFSFHFSTVIVVVVGGSVIVYVYNNYYP